MADARAVTEAMVQNAVADALAVLEASGTSDPAAVERLYVATTLEEVEQLRATLGLGDRPVPPRGRAPSDELWPAIHALERTLHAERDVYAGRYVDDDVVIQVGLVDRVSAITTRLRREFAFPSRLYVFAAEFTLAELKETDRRIQAEQDDLIDQGVPLLEYGLAVLRNGSRSRSNTTLNATAPSCESASDQPSSSNVENQRSWPERSRSHRSKSVARSCARPPESATESMQMPSADARH